MIGVSLTLNWNARFFSSRLKNFVLAQSFFTSFSPSGESSSVNAAWHAAAVAGGCEVENKNGRARKYKKSINSRDPQTYTPMTIQMVNRSAPTAPQHAARVRVVHHHDAAVPLRQVAKLRQQRNVAIHR